MISFPVVEVDVTCAACGENKVFKLKKVDFELWWHGRKYIQDAFSYLDDNDRETLISFRAAMQRGGQVCCGKCFDKLFSSEE